MKELLFSLTKKDLIVQTFRSGGKGGQNQNKVESGVRITHPASGAIGESREERSQLINKRTALKRLVDSDIFRLWCKRRMFEIDNGETTEQWVERMLQPENLKIEVLDETSKWVEVQE